MLSLPIDLTEKVPSECASDEVDSSDLEDIDVSSSESETIVIDEDFDPEMLDFNHKELNRTSLTKMYRKSK